MTLEKLWNLIKDHAIAVHLGGSKSIGLKNPKDTDIDIYCENLHELVECAKIIRDKNIKDFEIFYDIGNKKNIRSGEYERDFSKKVEFYGDQKLSESHILDKNRKKYINCLVNEYKSFQNKKVKKIYRILAGIYVLNNNKFEFTKKQKKNIQDLHDCNFRTDLLKYIETELDRLSKE